jgi:hypothetical protein
MTAKTRYFFVGSALVLVLGLGIGTVAYYGGVPTGLFASAPGPDELKYVPKDAAVVAYANVQDVMKSDLRQRLIKFEGSSKESGRDEFKSETGIDIERDIDHVIAFVGTKQDASDEANGLVIARGRFDEARLEALAIEHGGKVEQYKGKRVLTAFNNTHRHEGDGEGVDVEVRHGKMALSFIEPGLVAMGHVDMVRRVIDGSTKGGTIRDNPDMMKLVVENGDGSVWAVGRFDSLAAQTKLPAEVMDRIPPITWFSASGRINGGVQAVVKAETSTEEAAVALRDIIRGFTALAKMQTSSRPETQALWPEVELGGTGKTVSVSFVVSSALLDAAAKAGELKHKSREPRAEPEK